MTDTQFSSYIGKIWISSAWVVSFRQNVTFGNTKCDNKYLTLSPQGNPFISGNKSAAITSFSHVALYNLSEQKYV